MGKNAAHDAHNGIEKPFIGSLANLEDQKPIRLTKDNFLAVTTALIIEHEARNRRWRGETFVSNLINGSEHPARNWAAYDQGVVHAAKWLANQWFQLAVKWQDLAEFA